MVDLGDWRKMAWWNPWAFILYLADVVETPLGKRIFVYILLFFLICTAGLSYIYKGTAYGLCIQYCSQVGNGAAYNDGFTCNCIPSQGLPSFCTNITVSPEFQGLYNQSNYIYRQPVT